MLLYIHLGLLAISIYLCLGLQFLHFVFLNDKILMTIFFQQRPWNNFKFRKVLAKDYWNLQSRKRFPIYNVLIDNCKSYFIYVLQIMGDVDCFRRHGFFYKRYISTIANRRTCKLP